MGVPEARGPGLGRRLLTELDLQVASRGGSGAPGDEPSPGEAASFYRSAGYVEVPAFDDEPYAHDWCEKQLSGRQL